MRVPVTIRQKPLFCATCKAAGEESRLFLELGADEVSCSKKHGFPNAEAAEKALGTILEALAVPQGAPAEAQALGVQESPLESPEASYEPLEPISLPPLELEPLPGREKVSEVVLPVAEEPVIKHGETVVSRAMQAARAPAQTLEKGQEIVLSEPFAPANGKAQVVHDKRTGDLILGVRIPESHVGSLVQEATNQNESPADYIQRMIVFGLEARWFYIFFLVLFFAIPAFAAPHRKLTAVPRAVGRTAQNMVTFHDKTAAVEEWGSLAAALADGIVSSHTLYVVPDAREINPILGGHPSLGRYIGTETVAGMFEATLTQYGHESFDRNAYWKTESQYAWVKHWPFAISAAVHIAGIALDEHTIRVQCQTAGIVCR